MVVGNQCSRCSGSVIARHTFSGEWGRVRMNCNCQRPSASCSRVPYIGYLLIVDSRLSGMASRWRSRSSRCDSHISR